MPKEIKATQSGGSGGLKKQLFTSAYKEHSSMNSQTFQGNYMTFAVIDGNRIPVLFWVPSASVARGFGLVDGKCLALEGVDGFTEYVMN